MSSHNYNNLQTRLASYTNQLAGYEYKTGQIRIKNYFCPMNHSFNFIGLLCAVVPCLVVPCLIVPCEWIPQRFPHCVWYFQLWSIIVPSLSVPYTLMVSKLIRLACCVSFYNEFMGVAQGGVTLVILC